MKITKLEKKKRLYLLELDNDQKTLYYRRHHRQIFPFQR